MSWRIRGTYFESCNCDAICPCRRIDGVRGGRSTHGVCVGVLSWLIEEGAADGVDLAGLPVALACRYSDDEPGSPWTWILYLDARGSVQQRDALESIFTGRLGGDAERHFPWAWKASELVAVRPVSIDVDHTRRRQRLRIRERASVRIRDRFSGEETVTCVIPGHGSSARNSSPTRARRPHHARAALDSGHGTPHAEGVAALHSTQCAGSPTSGSARHASAHLAQVASQAPHSSRHLASTPATKASAGSLFRTPRAAVAAQVRGARVPAQAYER